MVKSCSRWLVFAGLVLGTQSCFWSEDFDDDEVDVVFPENQGTLSVGWTIEGEASAADCAARGAGSLEIVLFDALGAFALRDYTPCAEFSRSIDWPEGTWAAEITLVDGAALPVTDRQRFEDLTIVEDQELVIEVDFAAGSFQ